MSNQVKYPEVAHKIKFFIGDVRNLQSCRNAMPGVDYIFHAAALKQVPSCEFFLILLMPWVLLKLLKKRLQWLNHVIQEIPRFAVLAYGNVIRSFVQLGILADNNGKTVPTGVGLLLFGKNPQLAYPNALIRATIKRGKMEDVKTFKGPLLKQPEQIIKWVEKELTS